MSFFSKNTTAPAENMEGLSVSVEELIAQQQYLPYLSLKHNNLTSRQSGDVKSAFKGRGMELEEVRAYTFGDDIRDMDWRVTARKSEPYTKIYNEEKDRVITVFLDFSASMIFGTQKELKSVTAAKIAAMLGWLAVRNKDRFALMIYDGERTTYFKPQNNLKNLMAVFNAISASSREILSKNRIGNMSEALNALEFNQKGQGTIFILSDFHNINGKNFEKIAALSRRNKVYFINIFDIIEEIAPQDGEYEAQYGSQKVVFNTSTDHFKRTYQEYFAQNRENLKKNCQKFSCKYIEIRTDVPIFKQLSLI